MPFPFTRELFVNLPSPQGSDVIILQELLKRSEQQKKSTLRSQPKTSTTQVKVTGKYDQQTAEAVGQFQNDYVGKLSVTGVFDSKTANTLLKLFSQDGVKDNGFTAASMGKLFKISLPVHSNRSIETVGSLYDKNNKLLMKFKARTHGYRNDNIERPWPDFGNGDVGLTQFSGSGMTVTGVSFIDVNSKEPNATMFGPWPVLRFVQGVSGNAQFLIPNIRNGLLVHTGDWSTQNKPWNPTMDMPNSQGCVHIHPQDLQKMNTLLAGLGVQVRENPFSAIKYPYKPQGVIVVENV